MKLENQISSLIKQNSISNSIFVSLFLFLMTNDFFLIINYMHN